MPKAANDRSFLVRARHADAHATRLVLESSFEAAAIAFLEDSPHMAGDETSISVIVRDVFSGREHCFRVDLETGEPTSCR